MMTPTGLAARRARRPLFGGYPVIAVVLAWLAGVALRAVGPLPALPLAVWLAACALGLAGVIVIAFYYRRPTAQAWSRAVFMAAIVCCAALLGATRATAADVSTSPDAVTHLPRNTELRLRGVVAAEPDVRASFRFLVLEVTTSSVDGGRTWQPASGRVEASSYGPDGWFAPAYGDELSLTGKLAPVSGKGVPAGVVARMDGARAFIVTRGNGNPLLAALFDLRVRLAQAIQRSLPEPEAALLIGLLLGLKTPVLRSRLALFTATGTIHLVVPAGLKVAVLAELASRGLRPFGRWPRIGGSLGAVALYAALGGGGPAALRAAIMGALLVLASAFGRTYHVFTSLAVAVLVMTAVEPSLIYDAGFQLTTLATLGLPLLVPPLQRLLTHPLGRFGSRPLVAAISESLAVTLAAQLATLPVLALTFGELSLVAPLANLVTVPLMAPLMVLGSLLAAGSAIGGVLALPATILVLIVWPLLWYVDNAIAFSASLPAAAPPVGDLPPLVGWLYYAVGILILWRLWPHLRRLSASVPHRHGHGQLAGAALIAVLCLSLLGAGGAAIPALAAGSAARLDFLDVGPGGSATLLRLPSGVTVLVNGGPDGPALESALVGRLPFWQRSLDLVVLTDARAGETRGLGDAAAHFHIASAADAGQLRTTQEYLAYLEAMRGAGAVRTQVRQGNVLRLDARTTMRVLAPPQQLYPAGAGTTTASDDLILMLETPGLRALLLGAADDYALDALAHSAQSLASDVVELALVPGQRLDLSGALGDVLAAAHPRLVVVTDAPIAPDSVAARRAVHGDPATSDDDAAAALRATVLRTSWSGTLSLHGDAQGWSLG